LSRQVGIQNIHAEFCIKSDKSSHLKREFTPIFSNIPTMGQPPYLDVATATISLVRSIWISIQLDFRFPIDRIIGNDADFRHELFELFDGDVLRQTGHIHVAVLLVFNLEPR